MHIDTKQSRRAFLRRSAQLGVTGAAAPFIGSLGFISDAAAAAGVADYKALVCVFLYGGNDHANTLPPYDAASYNAYQGARSRVRLDRGSLAPTLLKPANDLGGRQYALNPALVPLMALFNKGSMAPLLNVGALIQPTSRKAYDAGSVRLPPKLFSHNDQQSFVQSFAPEGAPAGWGGRIGDVMLGANGGSALTCISLSGRSLWLSGQAAVPYAVQPGNIVELLGGSTNIYGSGAAYDAMRTLMTQTQQASWIAGEHAKVTSRSLALVDAVTNALAKAPASQFTTFTSSGNALADQLKMVARLIKVGPSLGLKRQVFLVGMGGFDTHSNQLQTHPYLLASLAQALSEFYAATAKLGVADKVTTFTASDFGRSLAENNDGSDHGWGGTQFLLGGAVKGKKIYGIPHSWSINTNDDVGGGRLIPTTSIDQLAATLAMWFGVPAVDLPLVLPNLRNFNPSTWNIGFL